MPTSRLSAMKKWKPKHSRSPNSRCLPNLAFAFCRAATDQPLDAVLRHELQCPLAAALDRLPAFDRQPQRPRHDGQLLQIIAAIRHPRWDRVVLAVVRERIVVER